MYTTSKRSARGGQSVAVTSEHRSNAASGASRRCFATSRRRGADTMTVQSPTQKLSASTTPGRAACNVATNAGGVLSGGGGGSGGPVGGAALGACSAPAAGAAGFAAAGAAGFGAAGGGRLRRSRGRRRLSWCRRRRRLWIFRVVSHLDPFQGALLPREQYPTTRIRMKTSISIRPKTSSLSKMTAHGNMNTVSTSKITNNIATR